MVSVKDTGIGIPVKAQPLIFDKFFEVQSALYHSTSPSSFMGGGLGLGLPYVNQVVRLMNGKVSLESREGHGTVFKVWLPMNNGAPPGNRVEWE